MTGADTFASPPHPEDGWAADTSPLDAPAPFAPPRPRRRRRGLILGIVLGATAVAVAVAVGIAWDVTATAREAAVQPAQRGDTGTLNGVQVVAGMCLTGVDGEATSVAKVTSVSCDDPHQAEAVAAYSYPETAWPGSERVAREATDFCAVQVGRALEAATVTADWVVWAPSQDTWAAGDRTALCVMTSDTELVGSFEQGTAAPA